MQLWYFFFTFVDSYSDHKLITFYPKMKIQLPRFTAILVLLSLSYAIFAQEGIKPPKLSGYAQTQYTYSDDGTNTFQIRRARIDLKGDLGSKIDYRFQGDLASSPKLVDAYVRFKLCPYFNIQLGEQKVVFSLENMMGPLTWETIELAQGISKLSGYSDISGEGSNGRDIGISAYGGFLKKEGYNIIDYSVGIYNGNGINLKDNNSHKNFAGKLEIHPIKPITLAASVYLGKINGALNTDELMPKNRYAFSARYDDKKLIVRAEYLRGKTNISGTDVTTTDAYYVFLGYTFKGGIQPLFRFDSYRKDVTAANGRSNHYVIGINYKPWKYTIVQLNYTIKDVQSAGKLVNQIAAMVTFAF